nr:MAG TPA: hypothetical protein [Bacteriophage sp.]
MGLSFHRIYLLHSRVLLFLVGLKNFFNHFRRSVHPEEYSYRN